MTQIKIKNLSKSYNLGLISSRTLINDLERLSKGILNSKKSKSIIINENKLTSNENVEKIWALKNINLKVNKGEILGVIGKNGSGKSTLLKILCRITSPTQGIIKINGKIASLLEIGTGFHPELTGKENIFLNGAILGMKKFQIDKKLDEVIEFSGIRQYINTPVKRFSSGMRVRLGFAVAAYLEPEILLIDEVLAVGDAEFQNKCIGKMKEIRNSEGRTIIFVSHNMSAIKKLCTRVILLNNGKILFDGSPNDAIDKYFQINESGASTHFDILFKPNLKLPLNISRLFLSDLNGIKKSTFDYIDNIFINVGLNVNKTNSNYRVSVHLINSNNDIIFESSDTDFDKNGINSQSKGEFEYILKIPSKLMMPGLYKISIYTDTGRSITGGKAIEKKINILNFTIIDSLTNRGLNDSYKKNSIIAPLIKWKLKSL